jgi:hypothetical protein
VELCVQDFYIGFLVNHENTLVVKERRDDLLNDYLLPGFTVVKYPPDSSLLRAEHPLVTATCPSCVPWGTDTTIRWGCHDVI